MVRKFSNLACKKRGNAAAGGTRVVRLEDCDHIKAKEREFIIYSITTLPSCFCTVTPYTNSNIPSKILNQLKAYRVV